MTKLRTRLLLAAAAVGGAAALSHAAPAHADPQDNYVMAVGSTVCEALDLNPTFTGIENAGKGIVNDTGWTYEEAGRVIKESVIVWCPRNADLWNRFCATYRSTAPSTPEAPAPERPQMQQAI